MTNDKRPKYLCNGDTFEYRGRTFKYHADPDEFMSAPWDEHDGHGVISEWTTREKSPGERILCEDHRSKRYYDVQATMVRARTDGWGCPHTEAHEVNGVRFVFPGHTTPGKVASCAVEEDYRRMRGWCAGDWCWVSVRVELVEYDDDDDEVTTDEGDSLSGIESDDDSYLVSVAYELADQIMSRVEVDEPEVQLSEN